MSRPARSLDQTARVGLRVFTAYLALCLAGLVVVLGTGSGTVRETVTSVAGVATPLATVLAIRWYRPTHAWAWTIIAASECLWAIAIVLDPDGSWYPHGSALSLSEILSTTGYVTTLAALALLAHGPTSYRRTLSILDAAVVTIAVWSLVWAVNRVVRLHGSPPMSTYAGFAYPAADAFIAVGVVRLAARATLRRPAYMFAAGGAAMLLVNDLAALVVPPGAESVVTVVLQYLALVLLGLAGLHPSMSGMIDGSAGGWSDDAGSMRILVLGLSLVTPPALVVYCGPDIDRLTAVVLGLACACSCVLVLVRLAGIVRVVEHQGERLAGLARSDHLTGLPNRRTVDAALERALTEAADAGQPLVVAVLDLDHFKVYNDTRGHAAGDRVLAAVASAWRANLPTDIFLGRYGGEEFLTVVRGRSTAEVGSVIESLRACTPGQHTFSAGLAEWDGVEDAVVLVSRADEALYRAKNEGRDCTWYSPAPGVLAELCPPRVRAPA